MFLLRYHSRIRLGSHTSVCVHKITYNHSVMDKLCPLASAGSRNWREGSLKCCRGSIESSDTPNAPQRHSNRKGESFRPSRQIGRWREVVPLVQSSPDKWPDNLFATGALRAKCRWLPDRLPGPDKGPCDLSRSQARSERAAGVRRTGCAGQSGSRGNCRYHCDSALP